MGFNAPLLRDIFFQRTIDALQDAGDAQFGIGGNRELR